MVCESQITMKIFKYTWFLLLASFAAAWLFDGNARAGDFDIQLAIHNHGLTSTYGNPETVKKILNARDKRIGVCLDAGHATGAGFDIAKVFREYDGRVFDIHLKDKKVEKINGKEVILDV